MFRPRLRNANGCLRCKKRHVKCDMARPQCGFCARWKLECIWPGTDTPISSNNPRQHHVSERSSVDLNNSPQLHVPNALSSNPFSKLPLTKAPQSPQVEQCLRNFFGAMVEDAVPFDIVVDRARMARGWMESIMSKEESCCAFVSYTARYQSQGGLRRDLQRLSLEYEASMLSILRMQVEEQRFASESTILATCVHLSTIALDMRDDSQLLTISRGIRLLLAARGGYDRAVLELKQSTVQSIFIADTLASLITARSPYLRPSLTRHKPSSFDSLVPTPEMNEIIHLHFDAAVADLFETLQCILYLRRPSQQYRSLSLEESQYLSNLLRGVDHQLCVLQASYISKASLSRIAVIAAVLVKQQIIAERAQHTFLIQRVLRCLQTVILTCETRDLDFLASLATWASLVALVGDGLEADREWFLKLVVSRLRAEDSQDGRLVLEQLRKRLSCFPWHNRIDRKLRAVYNFLAPVHGPKTLGRSRPIAVCVQPSSRD